MFKKLVGTVTECSNSGNLVKIKVIFYKKISRYSALGKKEKIIRAKDINNICKVNDKVLLLPTRKLTSTVSHKVLAIIN